MSNDTSPTDHLYKFIALVGVVLVVGGFVYPERERHQNTLRELQLQTEIDVLNARVRQGDQNEDAGLDSEDDRQDEFNKKYKQLFTKADEALFAMGRLVAKLNRVGSVDAAEAKADLKDLRTIIESARNRDGDHLALLKASNEYRQQRQAWLMQRNEDRANLDGKQRELAAIKKRTVLLQQGAFGSIGAGGGLFLIGFLLWYGRVQRHVDRTLKCVSKQAQADQKSTSSS